MEDMLGVGELIHTGEFYDKVNQFDFDLPFYKKWCRIANGEILELCCGTGRLTIPLKQTGYNITGLDFTPSMLERAKAKANATGVKIDFILGDMRNFHFKSKFHLIFIPFNSLQNTYTLEDIEKIFANVRSHLLKNGYFLFDIFNPSIEFMVQNKDHFREINHFRLDDGREVHIKETMEYDLARQVNRVRWIHTVDGKELEQQLDMRCFYPLEMDALLKYNHFKVLSKFGNFDETPFTSASMKQIYVCQRA